MSAIVCAGDEFISADLLARALAEAGVDAEFRRIDSRWPTEPFAAFDGVREAAGDPARLAELVRGADALVTHLAPLTAEVLAAGRGSLRVVGVTRGGPVNVDVAAATAAGALVVHLPGRNLGAVAEFCIGTMICAMRGLPAAASELAAGQWDAAGFRYERTGLELRAATVGLVGLGAVGLRVAELLRAFGSTVLAHDPYASAEAAQRVGVRLVALPELLSGSDVVSVHARLTPETKQMIDAGALDAMRPGAVLVNTARGELVDTRAVDAALESGKLRAAVLDVFDPEPPAPDDPLLRRPNVFATPHLAGASRQVAEESAARIAAEVATVLSGGTPGNCANPEVTGTRTVEPWSSS
ncbi:NAD(P)-dependent oxidoreductase [Pseudonocardia sp. MH-G8]|uniref:NAD(P)-dependent oxidoreductase n=1 Tax=Pseudonocardia sp. MH-G8 TaxID=1854588 RepID=UPI000BA18F24|nr:NAD(P)-dependent oxidoreductase [Pseudonocardia sp. MH-G8]OZM80104.1 hydroxyacid dehydrogenase [Pseudonocardia sp. MH-G8]